MNSVTVIRPEEPENTGFIARLAENFQFELRIVEPEFNLSEARETANNAQEKLREVEIFSSLEKAMNSSEVTVGTKPGRQDVGSFEPVNDVNIVLGPESSGLSNSELDKCDAVVSIETKGYNSLNLSHAAAIFMDHFQSEEDRNMKQESLEALDRVAPAKIGEIVKRSAGDSEEIEKVVSELNRLKSG